MTISAKSTKAQLLEYIAELEACQAVADQQIMTLEADLRAERPTIQDQAATIVEEVKAFCTDAYRFSCWCRKGFERVLTELRACA